MHDALPVLEENRGLLQAALAIECQVRPDTDAAQIERELEAVTDRIRSRCRSLEPRAVVAHAHALLFDELGLRGDTEDYYDPRNSCVGQVLDRRRGLPITLTLIYKLTLEPLGVVAVHGVNAPGHFLARVEAGGDFRSMLVDPFAGGRVLSVPEAVAQIRAAVGESVPLDADHLPLATHRAWIIRMLRNLVGVFGVRDASEERLAIEELMRLVVG